MNSADVASDGIVHEVLTKDNYDRPLPKKKHNYERWRVVMENYLRGQGLWEAVSNYEYDTDFQSFKKMKDLKALHAFQLSSWNHFINQNNTDPKATPDLEQGLYGAARHASEVEIQESRRTNDAKALHIIQLSCGRDIVDEISHCKTAKQAWNHLALHYSKESKAHPYRKQDAYVLDDSLGQQHKDLFRRVERGEYIGNDIMDSDVYMTSVSGRTLLHIAVLAGNVKNVEKLVIKGRDKLVYRQDKHGDTAIALVARYTGNTEIAKCMIETKKGSLTRQLEIPNKDNVIPILLAAANGHKELTSYLYSKTPFKVFIGSDSKNRVLLLSLCISAEIFDVPLRLLHRFKDLPTESLSIYKFSVPESLRESLSLSLPTEISNLPNPSLSDEFSTLIALAKMPSAFPSGGTRPGLRERIIYNNLSVEREFKMDYDIPHITEFVRNVTHVAHKRSPSAGWSCFGRRVWLFRQVIFSVLQLGEIFRGIAYFFVQIFTYLNIFGIRKIYDQKYAHYEVIGILYYFSQSIGEFDDRQLMEASAYDAMLYAAQHGIIEFINAMRDANPDLLTTVDRDNRGIFSNAILYRKQNVFQLIHCLHERMEIFRFSKDICGNNILHLTAYLGFSTDCDRKSGAALQMQREIQWFKAVESVVHPMLKEGKNCNGKKPYEIFTQEHEELMITGEKWAKDTATSYTIVGTLITTIMFAAVFTVPGGNNQDTGLPIFLHDYTFTMFLIADAFSLFSSATSVLIFIGILTSRYAENDFLKNMPLKLLFGVLFLFLSICSMIVAFCAAINMILKGYQTYRWFIVAPIMSLGSIPITIILLSQLHFMYEIFSSTWRNPIDPIKK